MCKVPGGGPVCVTMTHGKMNMIRGGNIRLHVECKVNHRLDGKFGMKVIWGMVGREGGGVAWEGEEWKGERVFLLTQTHLFIVQ